MSFKRFLIWSSGRPPAWWSRTIYSISKEGIMGNIHVNFYEVWTSGLAAPLFRELEPFVQVW